MNTYQKAFGLTDASFDPIRHDEITGSAVYKVTFPTKSPRILKVCPRLEDYRRERYFLERLGPSLPIPKLIDSFAPTSGIAGALLMEWLEGEILQAKDLKDPLAYELGKSLAKLHLHRTEGYGDPSKPESLCSPAATYFEEKFLEELNECRTDLPITLTEKCEAALTSSKHLLEAVDGPCIVHRDFRFSNIIVADGKLKGIIDWAGARSGFAEQDFAILSWEPIAKGYSSVRPLPNCKAIMPILHIGRSLAVIGLCLKNQTSKGKHAEIYQTHRCRLERALNGT